VSFFFFLRVSALNREGIGGLRESCLLDFGFSFMKIDHPCIPHIAILDG
jgi:hypothetical protein